MKKSARKLSSLIRRQLPSQELSPSMRRAATNNSVPDPEHFAKAAGLSYVSDRSPGIRREGSNPKKFRFVTPTGRVVNDAATLRRIRSLVIPPAWKGVWICPTGDGHIQATGTDARGRKQYRYHARWRSARDETKFHRMIAFGKALPAIRRKTTADLRRKGLPREKVLAAIVMLLEKTLIRVGNDEYARTNNSYGLTTMRDGHAEIRGGRMRFEFRGKSGVEHDIDLHDAGLAQVVKRCQDLPGQELFGYLNDAGKVVDIKSEDVNAYLREITGQEFTAKDFRTWSGTVLAAKALQEIREFSSQSEAKKNIVKAVESVAKRLGNTRTVCRKCYIHPAVIDAYMDGSLVKILADRAQREMKGMASLSPQEAAVLAFLQERLRRESKQRAA